MKVNTKPTASSTKPLTAINTGRTSSKTTTAELGLHKPKSEVRKSKQRIQSDNTSISVRHMSGTTRPLKALPLPEGWTEWRRLQKNYARYPRIELLFNIIIHILSVQYSKTPIVLNVTK
ncbi:hypothetical protein B9Z55_009456 [Caenorhabditis nigoni]|uniref:Uncharacterized protein n=1 Tax=Caenorhabditis nigoni TaxID=1611254 RepID=A0A2G5US26_9PELO|nr:hypothetical protein B9Z55_009456 [Caenorhabditis nigoni]